MPLTTWAIILCVAICIGIAGFMFHLSKQIDKRKIELIEINQQIQAQKDEIRINSERLDCTQTAIHENEAQIIQDRFTIDSLATRKKELNADIATQVENIEKLKTSYQITEEEFKKKYMAERKEWLDERQAEYVTMQEDFVEQFREENKKKLDAAQELTDELSQLKSSVAAATEVAKQHAEQENFYQFHSVQLADTAKTDIQRIESILNGISIEAGSAIAKVIWKVYYEKPVSDLCGRVVGNDRRTGIYMLTNRLNNMCYVGQAVDIADRWKQHIKRALNAEPRTQNKLYPAMYKEGIENFTFEIIEECEQSKLNEREDYWQDFYKAKEYGYSIK